MSANKTSPINHTYLISLVPPEGIVQTAVNLMAEFSRNGLVTSPIPPGVPLLETMQEPKPPVSGLLPLCNESLTAMNILHSSDKGWIYWPIESGGWFERLAAALSPGEMPGKGVSLTSKPSPLYPNCSGIPLSRYESGDIKSGYTSPEVTRIIKNSPGWRALNLICWSIEFIADRPWYKSTRWYPIWKRRLKRAPALTNNNKNTELA